MWFKDFLNRKNNNEAKNWAVEKPVDKEFFFLSKIM